MPCVNLHAAIKLIQEWSPVEHRGWISRQQALVKSYLKKKETFYLRDETKRTLDKYCEQKFCRLKAILI